MVSDFGFEVIRETTTISIADITVIGTTGMNPNTAVPPGVRDKTSIPATEATTTEGPGAGAGIIA
jgi:hypothetical protein